MRIKRKKIVASEQNKNSLSPAQAFLVECRVLESSSNRLGKFLADKHKEVFGKEAPNAMLCLIKDKISSELQYRTLKSSGVKITEKFLTNYKAYQSLTPEDLQEDAKFYTECDIKREKQKRGEDVMVKIKKKASIPVKTQTIKKERPGEVFVDIFTNNAKNKLSDEKIVLEIAKRCLAAKKYSVSEVQGYRNGYNKGLLSGQKTKPSVQSVKYASK